MKYKDIKVVPFRYWWCVEWKEDNGEYCLLFRAKHRANGYMNAALRGASRDELFDLALQRLKK